MTGVSSTSSALASLGCRLVPAHEVDAATLLRFESDERDHFRHWIPDRGDAYFELSAVERSLRDAAAWWAAGTDLLHVVVEHDGGVVARANLTDIAAGRAEVGYRVARAATGRGIASAALTELLGVAVRSGIEQVVATTSRDNEASARVLVRCGFEPAGERRAALAFDGRRLDARDWEIRLEDPAR